MRPLLYAHRGAAKELPENTLPAFRRAIEVGAGALETDVHRTRDGHVVISHDPTGERAAGIARAIRALTLDEVKAWDVGRRFREEVPGVGAGPFTVPTLEELLVEVPSVRVNVDIKQHDAETARAVVAVVRRLGAAGRVLLTSFDAATIAAVRALGYEGATGLGRGELLRLRFAPGAALRRWPVRGQAAQVPVRAGPIAFDGAGFVARAHAAGVEVHYWTINEPAEAERLLRVGADGIMTDDPAAIAPVLARFAG